MTPYILIVDDERSTREFLRLWLESAGYVVKDAADATQALELITQEPPTVVLLDICMPERDGIWLAERIKSGWKDVPIVFASAVDDMQVVEQARRLGAVDYVTKPFQWDLLIQALDRAHARLQ
jgi:CheY-like chemotaxis protein